MNRLTLLIGLLILLLTLGAGASIIWHQLQCHARLAVRLKSIRYKNGVISGAVEQKSIHGVAGLVLVLGSIVVHSGLLSENTVAGLEKTLILTNLRGPSALGLFVGAKLLLLLVMPLLALAVLQHLGLSPLVRNIGIAGAALAGLLGPDWWISWQYKKYLHAVTLGLPDALDLMVICAEAGLTFEPAITRVANEIRAAHPAVSEEFSQTASELRVVADSKVALQNMGVRTGLEGIKRMTSVLAQTMKYGTPLSDALRVLSVEMRQEMLIRYETRAARLPVLLTLPMILFILPCIFLIVGGPAVIQVMKSYYH